MLMMVGAGIAVGGLVAGCFAPFGLTLLAVVAGIALMIGGGSRAEKDEQTAVYPSYKY